MVRKRTAVAWPLSEDDYLCVYDANTRPKCLASRPQPISRANYGIYLIDAFGNRELLYRDPGISCHQPIPLRPRPKPPVTSESSKGLAGVHTTEATVVVSDVYESFSAWPAGTQIAARVWQILPLSVAPAARNNGIQVPGTGSINTARAVLGTVPVEADGSAHFVVPAGKELFFQALDEHWDETHQHANTWPWGDKWDPEKCNNADDHNAAGGGFRVNQSAPVGSYPQGASPYGCLDMVGNAWEWVADSSKSYPGNPEPFDRTDKFLSVKGGCWDDGPLGVRCSYRGWYLPPSSSGTGPGDSDYIGFRVAR